MNCSVFIVRGIFNIMCGGLNNMRCRFLIMRSGYIIMPCRSCKWCSILIITCCAFVKCRATFLLCKVCLHYSQYTTASIRWISINILPLLVCIVLFSLCETRTCIFNIISGGLNNMRCSFLIMRSGFVIMRSRSCKWCSRLIITCCAFVKCSATVSFM